MNLYILGELKEIDANAVAIVGSRQMTAKGRENAYKFAYELARHDVTIISGLARGIDTVAHEGALAAGGRTIAVLGSGVDTIYPPENKNLADKIIKSGAVVSEFPEGTKPLGKNFLQRNSVISALSKAVIIIEGSKRSGTISTATWAANQGKEVFVIPGSEATDYLIENGATVVTDPSEILDYLRSL